VLHRLVLTMRHEARVCSGHQWNLPVESTVCRPVAPTVSISRLITPFSDDDVIHLGFVAHGSLRISQLYTLYLTVIVNTLMNCITLKISTDLKNRELKLSSELKKEKRRKNIRFKKIKKFCQRIQCNSIYWQFSPSLPIAIHSFTTFQMLTFASLQRVQDSLAHGACPTVRRYPHISIPIVQCIHGVCTDLPMSAWSCS